MEHENYWQRSLRGRAFSRRTVLRGAAAGAGLSALALAACSSSNNNGGNTAKPAASSAPANAASGSSSNGAATRAAATAAPAGSSAAASPAAQQPKRGGTLSFWSGLIPAPHYDPHLDQTDIVHSSNVGQVYSRLLKFKTGPEIVNNHIPTPDAAEKWEQIDPLNYTFTLRDNVKFHKVDPVNGRAMTMQDAIYSYERQRSLKTNAIFLADIAKWEAPDAKTLKVTLTSPTSDFILNFASTFNKIVAKELVEKFGDLKSNPVVAGTGPFMVETLKTDSSVIVRNPDYFIQGLPYVDKVKWTVIPDRNTALAALSTGDLSAINGVDIREIDQLKGQIKGGSELKYALPTPYGMMANTNVDPTKDVRVRQAISFALDRQAIIKTAWFGDGELTTSMSINKDIELSQDELGKMLAYDQAKAKALLAEAGVKDWAPRMTNWNNAQAVASGELVNPMLKAVGINATTQLTDNVKSVQTMMGQDLLIHWGAWPYFSSPTLDLKSRWRSDGPWNGPKLNDAELDGLIDKQAVELDTNKRNDLLKQIQRKVLTDLSVMPVVRPVNHGLARPEVVGYAWGPYLSSENVMLMWLKS